MSEALAEQGEIELEDLAPESGALENGDEQAATEPEQEGEGVEEFDILLDGKSLDPEATDESEDVKDPSLVKTLRKTIKEKSKAERELSRRLAELEAKAEKSPEPVKEIPKPKMSDPDVDFDDEKFEKKLDEWHASKLKAQESKAQKEQAEKQVREQYQAKVEAYQQAKSKLGRPDFDDAEEAVIGTLPTTYQDAIVSLADRPEVVVYALGKNPERAKALAEIKDPAKFIYALGKLEAGLQLKPRKAKPQPEKVVKGSGPRSGGVDATLERLRKAGKVKEAIAYRRKLQAKK